MASDVEMKLPPKKITKAKKIPTSPAEDMPKDGKKLSTKEMIAKALSESKSRKGISLYAIKKYIQDNFSVDTEKINYLIKKHLKESVESGTVIQTKGIGASGSFRLAPGSKQPKNPSKKPKQPKETTDKGEQKEKPEKKPSKKPDAEAKPKKKVAKSVTISTETATKVEKVMKKSKSVKEKSLKENPKPGTSNMKTPKKKLNMMKRRSIGSIIKPPKMKPKAQPKGS